MYLQSGHYNASSCGAVANRPLALIGEGAHASVVSCAGSNDRALTVTDSVAITGVTFSGGNVTTVVTGVPMSGPVTAGGGGAVLVDW